ncbi:hypothetical protein ACH5RR_000845 [Cinchona calisaya]|uniref:Uncharacterized protein n=1 Tax=Cinchona calisaya TaxID=153742 RepID=A0ABD3B1U4_9GENT
MEGLLNDWRVFSSSIDRKPKAFNEMKNVTPAVGRKPRRRKIQVTMTVSYLASLGHMSLGSHEAYMTQVACGLSYTGFLLFNPMHNFSSNSSSLTQLLSLFSIEHLGRNSSSIESSAVLTPSKALTKPSIIEQVLIPCPVEDYSEYILNGPDSGILVSIPNILDVGVLTELRPHGIANNYILYLELTEP